MADIKTTVLNIQKFSLNDGPGIRTTVFLKGCPLDCLWCHNPESKKRAPQLMLHVAKCIGCGMCLGACPKGLHSFTPEHQIERAACTACGKCSEVCIGALEVAGKEMSVAEVLDEVMKDKPFYDNSGGGLTLSGGEPLLHFDFTLALLQAAKARGLHTCIETCGYAPWEHIKALLPYVDIFLWDVKESNATKHKEYTGVSNEPILQNLRAVNKAGGHIVLRCPIIPGLNDREEHLLSIAALAEELENVERIDIEPYHPLGQEKSEALGKDYSLSHLTFPEEETVQAWITLISSATKKPVQKA